MKKRFEIDHAKLTQLVAKVLKGAVERVEVDQ